MPEDKPLFEVDAQPPTPEEIERQRVREEYRAKLAEKLKDPEFRKIEGFPIGTDEAILALSDPPYYTACPNPFIEEWLKEHGKQFDPDTDDYHREPFAADVSEGKNHPIYNAHSYHTKVPHRAIMRYILHYTEPGNVVYDGFCGTGMTGVAAQLCGDRTEVEALGFRVSDDGSIWEQEQWEARQALNSGRANPHPHLVEPRPFSKLGARRALLNDLAPAATYIAYNYNTPTDAEAFESEAKRILANAQFECGWMYATLHRESNKWTDAEWASFVKQCVNPLRQCKSHSEARAYIASLRQRTAMGVMNYVIWSDVFICPECSMDIVFWDAALDKVNGKVLDDFRCPSCSALVTKQRCERKVVVAFDSSLGKTLSQAVQVPVQVIYSVGKKRHEKAADAFDVELMSLIESLPALAPFPTDSMPPGEKTRESQRSHGATHAHHFYTKRNISVIALLWQTGRHVWFPFNALTPRATRMHRIAASRVGGEKKGEGGATVGIKDGTLFIPSMAAEMNVLHQAVDRITSAKKALLCRAGGYLLETGSATALKECSCVDYVFTDPPFGGNRNYSELSFLWEAWFGVFTNNKTEAISSATQGKGLPEYQALMQKCFARYYAVLKPARWMTVEFHNSANSVWNAIQESLERVGFVVADVRVLDKGQYSFNQLTTTGATKQDLVISCYKPSARFVEQFEKDKGTAQGVREFIEQHLEMLPVAPTTKTGSLESLAERTLGVLFDRMIAYHLVRSARIPLSASEFRVLLEDFCYERDGMYFLPSQVVRYDALKSRGIEVEQLSIFVRDEKSAVQWVRNELDQSPQTLGDLTPKFMQASQDWGQHEVMPELRDLLQQYFIREEDENWVVAEPDNERHLEEIRKKAMLREFQEYVKRPGQLKLFRTEAVLTGFAHCWESKQYDVIVGVCEKIPAKVLREIQDLVMFYDIAKERAPEKVAQFEFKWE